MGVGEHETARISSSPLVFDGNIYVGVANGEEAAATDPAYPCCTARGQFVSVSLATGHVHVRWRRYTMPPAERAGSWPDGVARYAPSGAGIWSSPAIDAASRTVFHGTGNGFTGTDGPGQDEDTVIALNLDTGELRWKQQINHPDVWTVGCMKPLADSANDAPSSEVRHCALAKLPASASTVTVPVESMNSRPLVGFVLVVAIAPSNCTMPDTSDTAGCRRPPGALVQPFCSVNGVNVAALARPASR